MRIEGKNRKIRNAFTLMIHLGVIEFFRGKGHSLSGRLRGVYRVEVP